MGGRTPPMVRRFNPATEAAHDPLAVWGFCLALGGVVTLGVTGIIGGIVSLLAVRRKPRGLAVAGIIIGFGQLLVIVPLIILLVMSSNEARKFSSQYMVTVGEVRRLDSMIQLRNLKGKAFTGTLKELNGGIEPLDGWGNPMRVGNSSTDENSLPRVESAGSDGIFGNGDDFFMLPSSTVPTPPLPPPPLPPPLLPPPLLPPSQGSSP